jgi:hypothetical protein
LGWRGLAPAPVNPPDLKGSPRSRACDRSAAEIPTRRPRVASDSPHPARAESPVSEI